jgi:hypothetical protein
MWHMHPGPITAVMMIAWSPVTTIATTPAPTCSNVVDGRQQLRVRIVPGTMDPLLLARVRGEVDAIWSRYQIDVAWEPPRASDQQASPDLWVQFVDERPPSGRREGRVAIAWLKFDKGAPTHHIQVSKVAATALLATKSWAGGRRRLIDGPISLQSAALGRIVGRAVAHEMGHFLLASPKHADRGLMRAVIDPEHFVSPGIFFLTLQEADVQALRAARVARCERAR